METVITEAQTSIITATNDRKIKNSKKSFIASPFPVRVEPITTSICTPAIAVHTFGTFVFAIWPRIVYARAYEVNKRFSEVVVLFHRHSVNGGGSQNPCADICDCSAFADFYIVFDISVWHFCKKRIRINQSHCPSPFSDPSR